MAYHRAMIFRRYGTFTGGIDLPDEKRATLEEPVRPCGTPAALRVPLAPCAGRAAEPVVNVGDRVRAGERLAEAADEAGVDVFAPLDGRVEAFATVAVAGRNGFADSPAVVLADLASPADTMPAAGARGRAEPAFNWPAASPEEIIDRVAAGGLTTYGRPPQPLGRWLARARRKHCRTLIGNVMEQEPYVTADHRVLAEHGAAVMEGLAILGRAIGVREIVLAADRRRTGAYEASMEAAERFGIARVALPHKYPVGAATILTKVLTRRETPPGRSTIEAGAAVVDAATCLAAYRWVVGGARPLGRVVTVAGPGVEAPANLWVPFGADCAELAGNSSGLLVHGGPMAGLCCDGQAVVTPATTAVLALEPPAPPLPTPCIRCGWCTDHCPARLNVAALNDAFELSLVAAARRGGVLACVECGVCSYVCPARLPLAQRVKRLKRHVVLPPPAPEAPGKPAERRA